VRPLQIVGHKSLCVNAVLSESLIEACSVQCNRAKWTEAFNGIERKRHRGACEWKLAMQTVSHVYTSLFTK